MPIVRPQERPAIVYFSMTSILFFDGMYIYPQNKLYQLALEEYLLVVAEAEAAASPAVSNPALSSREPDLSSP